MQLETFFSVPQQTSQFLLSVVLGAAYGVFYDCFRVLRIIFPSARKKAAVCIGDIIFILCCGAAMFIYSEAFCRSGVRLFFIIGALAGFVLYLLTIGNIVTGIIRAVVNAVCGVLRKVYSTVFAPIVKFFKGNCQKLFGLFVHSYKNIKKVKINSLPPLKNGESLLYNKETKVDNNRLS